MTYQIYILLKYDYFMNLLVTVLFRGEKSLKQNKTKETFW